MNLATILWSTQELNRYLIDFTCFDLFFGKFDEDYDPLFGTTTMSKLVAITWIKSVLSSFPRSPPLCKYTWERRLRETVRRTGEGGDRILVPDGIANRYGAKAPSCREGPHREKHSRVWALNLTCSDRGIPRANRHRSLNHRRAGETLEQDRPGRAAGG